ncbi:pseudouridine-5'-phosphate glycosidase [Myxococcota bacterium]
METAVVIRKEVLRAMESGRPVVALESAFIAHGMPYPDGVTCALELSKIVRECNAEPAVIAVLEGAVRVGLNQAQIDYIGASDDVRKVSRRDLAAVVASGQPGATTVSASMFCARSAGIDVLVTGGIGGVHRGAENSMDISADLAELARTEVVVVCAGAKAVLDTGRTLEVLETLGVPVIGFQTAEFPGFYSRGSGHMLDHRVQSIEEAAEVIRAHWELGLGGGLVIANPIPENHALDRKEIESHIEALQEEADLCDIHGAELTPFLLKQLTDRTKGRTLKANFALLRHNAQVAAEIAGALLA